MSGPPNQPPYGGGRVGGWNPRVNNPTAPSPSFLYRPPSPWTPVAPSPPPIISGPRRHSLQSPAPLSPTPHAMSPGPQGLRGTRAGSNIPQPRPQWPGPQPYGQQQHQHYQSVHGPSPTPFNGNGAPKPHVHYSHPMSSFQLSPSPSPLIFQNQPAAEYFYQQPLYGNNVNNQQQSHPFARQQPSYEFVGAPMEPPLPKSYVVYDDEEETGPSTREIIANQSQDYIDEKLAEYQMTILQLQGEFFFKTYYLVFILKILYF